MSQYLSKYWMRKSGGDDGNCDDDGGRKAEKREICVRRTGCVCVSSLKCHHYRAHHRLHGKCLMVACRKRCRFIILITPFATVPQSAHL